MPRELRDKLFGNVLGFTQSFGHSFVRENTVGRRHGCTGRHFQVGLASKWKLQDNRREPSLKTSIPTASGNANIKRLC
jgi:hypothetical protein